MKIIELEQGTDQWKQFRRTHVTSTDSAVICEKNPWKTPYELYIEKMDGIETPVNERMRRGNELEEHARQLLIKETGIDFKPAVVVHDTHHWAMASLDGLSPCNQFICEIKAPNRDTHELALDNIIKPYYFAQMQHALFVTHAILCCYFSYMPEHLIPTAVIIVQPDKEFIAEMIIKEKEFYECMCLNRPPNGPWKLKGKNE